MSHVDDSSSDVWLSSWRSACVLGCACLVTPKSCAVVLDRLDGALIVLLRMKWYLVQHIAVIQKLKKKKRSSATAQNNKSGLLKKSIHTSCVAFVDKDLPLSGVSPSAGILSKCRLESLL